MNKRPPILLSILIVQLACALFSVVVGWPPADLVPMMLLLVLSLFVFHGSAIACNLLALVYAYGAQRTIGEAVGVVDHSTVLSVVLVITAVLLAAVAHYLFFNRAVKAFQGKGVSDQRLPG
ncbi:hypothetical protein V0R50_25730 [Pseudomonas sp. 148P]|uniref:Uncharacterized protein n=1 Tax=Pseudomonas ulcerans TaxID=3115852 RepID=A0ABU7HYI1_9PSED|nr:MULTISPECIES: hypothetical protein [unclassified Pseudomonas]MEE1925207.1 hypothetical protein [Pseudomonas sp. 147P]MEE1936637.1 hypothetical protein [Pseudomonas sp. 148P]